MTRTGSAVTLVGWLDRLRASTRLLICSGIAAVALAVGLLTRMGGLTSVLLAWDAFCAAMLCLSWVMFFGLGAGEVHR